MSFITPGKKWCNGILEPSHKLIFNYIADAIAPNDICFDVGAFVGDRTSVIAATGAQVIAIEPVPQSFKRLERRFADNPGVTICEAAVSGIVGRAQLHICSKRPELSSIDYDYLTRGHFTQDPTVIWDHVREVNVITLDVLVNKFGLPVYVKLDIEGAEASALSGLTHKVPFLSFEFGSSLPANCLRCVSQLNLLGNYKFNVGLGETTPGSRFMLETWIDGSMLQFWLDEVFSSDRNIWGDIYARHHDC